jgi:serine/threonine protein kinase/tetratricopeptide (TPR) repeat protein
MIGATISHYHILERLGAGGMGEVYKAEDLRLRRPVALKLLPSAAQQSDEARLRFRREAQAASALSHPNIATIYEIDEVEHEGARYSFIAMEYIAGQTLKEASRSLEVSEVIEILLQIADALGAAHRRGVIHRDLKPSNVMLTEGRRVKVLDFGVAKYQPALDYNEETASIYHTDLLKTTPGTVFGTFAYMSPEQELGREIDPRSDIFSLGVMAFELLAGRLPFEGRSTLAVVDAVLHATPPPLISFNTHVSPELESIVFRMLEKEAARRYPDLAKVHRDLEAVRRRLDSTLESEIYQTNVSRSAERRTDSSSDTFTLSARHRQSVAVMNFANITGAEADQWLGVGIAETVTADLKSIEGLTVIGRERVYETLRNLGVDEDPDDDVTFATRVGREVGAHWIIIGGYQRLGELLRITARFVQVSDGEVLRTVKIDGRMSEVFDLQDKIVYELSRGLDFRLRSGEREMIAQPETEVIAAYEAFTKGMIIQRTLSREAIDEAISLFERATELDPNYSRAHGHLGYARGLKGQFLGRPELIEEGIASLQKSIELSPQTADPYAGIGLLFIALGRVDEAIGAIRRALAFAPDDHINRAVLGRAYFLGKGMFREAAAEYERALASNPQAGWVALQLAHCYAYLGEFTRGEAAARQAIALQEQFLSGQEMMQIVGAHTRLAYIYYRQGRYDDAIAELYRELVFLRPLDHLLKERALIEVHQKLASAYARQENAEDARRAYEQVLSLYERWRRTGSDEPFTRYYLACAAAVMGERETALEHLSQAAAMFPALTRARAQIEPDFDSLRDDPRFRALVAEAD